MQSLSQADVYRPAGMAGRIGLADTTDLVARVALGAIFLWSGLDKLVLHTAGNVGYMQAYDIPFASLLIWPAGLAELLGGVLLVIGYRAGAAAAVLALFTLVVTPIFHNFWAVPDDQALNQTIHFMKNLALVGGLLHVVGHGSGKLALDAPDKRGT